MVLGLLLAALQIGEWDAPECPASLLSERVPAGSDVRVSVIARGGVLVGSLEVEREGKLRRRTHEAPSCASLIDALALGVELANALPLPTRGEGKGEGAERIEIAEASVAKTQEPNQTQIEIAAHATVVYGPAPSISYGAEAGISILPRNLFRLELTLSHARTPTLNLGPARARFSLTTARLAACSPTLTMGPAAVSVCATVAAGALWAQGFPTGLISMSREATLPWVDVAPQGRVTFRLAEHVSLEARAGPTFPITRHTFVFELPNYTAHQVPFIGFEGTLGLAVNP